MASRFREGESVYFPFKDGKVLLDSKGRPRMYGSVEQFKGKCPTTDPKTVTLVEYAPVIHAKWELQLDLSRSTGQSIWNCTNCGYPAGIWTANSIRCPACGAIMGAEDDQ